MGEMDDRTELGSIDGDMDMDLDAALNREEEEGATDEEDEDEEVSTFLTFEEYICLVNWLFFI